MGACVLVKVHESVRAWGKRVGIGRNAHALTRACVHTHIFPRNPTLDAGSEPVRFGQGAFGGGGGGGLAVVGVVV